MCKRVFLVATLTVALGATLASAQQLRRCVLGTPSNPDFDCWYDVEAFDQEYYPRVKEVARAELAAWGLAPPA